MCFCTHGLHKFIGRSHLVDDVVFLWCLDVCRFYGASDSCNPLARRSPTVRMSCGVQVVHKCMRFKYGCRTFHSLGTYMFVNHKTPVRLTHFHCKIGVLASNGTYSFPEEWPSILVLIFSIVLSISMITPLQQLIVCLGSAHSQFFVICNFDTSSLLLNCSGNYCLCGQR
jgi:hypothetical protein